MKFCSNCSKELPDNCKFCPNCGTPAPAEQKAETTQSSEESFGYYNTRTTYQDQEPQYSSYSAEPSSGAPTKTHGLVIAGFVTGIAGICLCWIPIFGIILSLAALGLSIAGFVITKSRGLKKPFALAALIISIVAAGVSIILTIAMLAYAVNEFIPYGRAYSNIRNFEDIFDDYFSA